MTRYHDDYGSVVRRSGHGPPYTGHTYSDGSVFEDPDPSGVTLTRRSAHPGPLELCPTHILNVAGNCKRVEGSHRTFTVAEIYRSLYPTFPANWRGKWPAQAMKQANAPAWTGTQRFMWSLGLFFSNCIHQEFERATNAPPGPGSRMRLSAAQLKELRELIGLYFHPYYHPSRETEWPDSHVGYGWRLSPGGIMRRILNAPQNVAGAYGIPGGGTCWYYAQPSDKILPRWIAGGGEMGPILDKILPPPDFLGLPPDSDTGEPSWTDWSIEDVFDFFDIDPLNCSGYFNGLRRDFGRIAQIFAQAGMPGCAEVAASTKENVPDPEAPLHIPGPRKFPWGLGLAALGLFALLKSGALAGVIGAARKRDARAYCYNKKRTKRIPCPKD